MYVCVHAGIDVDIDVEHDGQRTKVTPPSKGDGGVGGASTEKGGANSEVGKASPAGGATEGSKVSEICITADIRRTLSTSTCIVVVTHFKYTFRLIIHGIHVTSLELALLHLSDTDPGIWYWVLVHNTDSSFSNGYWD